MRISDWSSDVCSSDLGRRLRPAVEPRHRRHRPERPGGDAAGARPGRGAEGVGTDRRAGARSDERRVGKECGRQSRSRWSPSPEKKNTQCRKYTHIDTNSKLKQYNTNPTPLLLI